MGTAAELFAGRSDFIDRVLKIYSDRNCIVRSGFLPCCGRDRMRSGKGKIRRYRRIIPDHCTKIGYQVFLPAIDPHWKGPRRMTAGRRHAVNEKLQIRRPLGADDIISVRATRRGIVLGGQKFSVARADNDAAFHVGRRVQVNIDRKHQRAQSRVRRSIDLRIDGQAARCRSWNRQQFVSGAAILGQSHGRKRRRRRHAYNTANEQNEEFSSPSHFCRTDRGDANRSSAEKRSAISN